MPMNIAKFALGFSDRDSRWLAHYYLRHLAAAKIHRPRPITRAACRTPKLLTANGIPGGFAAGGLSQRRLRRFPAFRREE